MRINKIKEISKMRNKKAQHEIVGFILIVVIVVVIGLFLLVFYLRKSPIEKQSLDIQNFLQSSMTYTTQCALSYVPEYENIEDLIKSCYRNQVQECIDGRMGCEVLNETLSDIVDKSWQVSPDKPVKAYSMFIYYEENYDTEEESEERQIDEILRISEGNCTGSKTGAEYPIQYSSGNIYVDIEICYN